MSTKKFFAGAAIIATVQLGIGFVLSPVIAFGIAITVQVLWSIQYIARGTNP